MAEEVGAEASASTLHGLWRIFLQNKFSLVSRTKFPHHKHGMKLSKGAAIGSNPSVPVNWLTPDDKFSPLWKESNRIALSTQAARGDGVEVGARFRAALLLQTKTPT